MRRKLAGREGLTLVEMLAAVAILVLLALILNTGLQMAVHSYRAMVAQSETELLLSTLADTLADELRYASDVITSGDDALVSYTSDSFGTDTALRVDAGDGKVYADSSQGAGQRVLPDGAYGSGGRYEVEPVTIKYDAPIFTLSLSVKEKDGSIGAAATIKVRCLNPTDEAAETPPGGETP